MEIEPGSLDGSYRRNRQCPEDLPGPQRAGTGWAGGDKWQPGAASGGWLLVLGSRAILPTLLRMTGRLAESGPVKVVDCGNMFDIFLATRATTAGLDVYDRIKVCNAYTCQELLAVLQSLPVGPAPFVILDLLRTFLYTNVAFEERKRLLALCLAHMDRLEQGSGGLVSVHPPGVLCQAESELLEMVTKAARDIYRVEMAASHSLMERLS